jgi:DNA-directed RNA polymerase subunit H (RpoH/RPB5)
MDMIMLWLSKLLKVMFLISVLIFFSQLPRMLQKDAISKYYGLEKGQVVKVTYSGEITESHVTYRCIWWCFLLCVSLLYLSSGSCRILCIVWRLLYGHLSYILYLILGTDVWFMNTLGTMTLAPTFLKNLHLQS